MTNSVSSFTGNPMAFHANLGSSLNIQDIYKEDTVVYDDVITNVGNGYDSETGIFTCRKAGLYSFSWTSLTPSGKRSKHDSYSTNKE